ncbi:MAG: hypothetical protein IPK70_14795 [Flavobacteriales bacterium]|jgi:hypothetical protein|nr:hypothetical protein [Flavobacteriales bacterium]
MHSKVDPNLFFLDFERVSEVLLAILLLALLIERALALLFESRAFIERVAYTVKHEGGADQGTITDAQPRNRGIKELIALGVSFYVCWWWDFDALSILLPVSHSKMTLMGMLITAMIIAGGSKGAAKLFSDWMGIKSTAQKEIDAIREASRTRAAAQNKP